MLHLPPPRAVILSAVALCSINVLSPAPATVLASSAVHPEAAATVSVSDGQSSNDQRRDDKRSDDQSGNIVFRTNVRRVVEDVVVTDDHGNAVHGLTRDDFLLKEDGKPQKVPSFDAHDGSHPDFMPPRVPPLPPNTYVDLPREPERGPLYVILYDMVNMELTDQGFSRKPLLNFIQNKPPGTRFAIFLNTDATRMIQGFTQDRELLYAALTAKGPGPHVPNAFLYGANYGTGDTFASLSLFNQLAQYLENVPGRKNLLWLSGKFPLDLNPSDLNPAPGSLIPVDEVKQTIAALTRAHIAVYPIDIRGVIGYDSISGSTAAASSPGRNPGRAPGPATAATPGKQSGPAFSGGVATSMLDYANEDHIAELTGGHAYHGNNDIAALLNQATEQGASFYTLSYAPSGDRQTWKQRNIDVTLTRPGFHLAYRRFYYLLPPDAKLYSSREPQAARVTMSHDDTLFGSIAHGSPLLHDLVFSTHLRTEGEPALATPEQMAQIEDEPAYFRIRRRKQSSKPPAARKLQKYVIEYRVVDPELKTRSAAAGKPAMLEFAAAAYDQDGRMVNGVLNQALATATDPKATDAKAPKFFNVDQEIDVPLDAAWLRLVVRETITDRTGSLEVRLPLLPERASQASR